MIYCDVSREVAFVVTASGAAGGSGRPYGTYGMVHTVLQRRFRRGRRCRPSGQISRQLAQGAFFAHGTGRCDFGAGRGARAPAHVPLA